MEHIIQYFDEGEWWDASFHTNLSDAEIQQERFGFTESRTIENTNHILKIQPRSLVP